MKLTGVLVAIEGCVLFIALMWSNIDSTFLNILGAVIVGTGIGALLLHPSRY